MKSSAEKDWELLVGSAPLMNLPRVLTEKMANNVMGCIKRTVASSQREWIILLHSLVTFKTGQDKTLSKLMLFLEWPCFEQNFELETYLDSFIS